MKKILSLLLVGVMMFSMIPAAYATNTYDQDYEGQIGTAVSYDASTVDADGDGQPDNKEAYTITVPAKLASGETGTVTAEGTWDSNKFLAITTPEKIDLTYGAQKQSVSITFGTTPSARGFTQIGSSMTSVSNSADVTVAQASGLFGVWEGVLEYTVVLVEKGDINQDGQINLTDKSEILKIANGTVEQPEDIQPYDLNNDGSITMTDVGVIEHAIAGEGLSTVSAGRK